MATCPKLITKSFNSKVHTRTKALTHVNTLTQAIITLKLYAGISASSQGVDFIVHTYFVSLFTICAPLSLWSGVTCPAALPLLSFRSRWARGTLQQKKRSLKDRTGIWTSLTWCGMFWHLSILMFDFGLWHDLHIQHNELPSMAWELSYYYHYCY